MIINQNKNKSSKFLGSRRFKLAAIFFIFCLFLIVSAFVGLIGWFELKYENTIYPGITVGGYQLSGLTREQALEKFSDLESTLQEKGILFKAKDREVSISPVMISANDPDLSKPIIVFERDKTVDYAFEIGRKGNWLEKIQDKAMTLLIDRKLRAEFSVDKQELLNVLKASFSDLENPPINASLLFNNDEYKIIPEEPGYVFDYDQAVFKLESNISNLDLSEIQIDFLYTDAEITREDAEPSLKSLETILNIDSIKLVAESRSWVLKNDEFKEWLEFQDFENEIVVGLNKDKVLEFLNPIAESVYIKALDAKFEMENGKVTKFQASQDGKKLNLEESYQKINNQIIIGASEDLDLVVEVEKAKVATGELNDLGIEELIGRGVSNFAGSPANRRHNIAVGAAILNGLIIKPGETFSLISMLSPVNAANGYKPELVIKGNRTVPEYGGGLCQIGTTAFRVALRSGLPIIERRNHSYRVSYYEPAGMDATIYEPNPDVRFLNDTPSNILFATRIEGNSLIFEFYGTDDGRKVIIEPDPPSIYNITSPGAPREIETTDLAPGDRKKIESAHAGATTYFKYTVKYIDGRVEEKDFYSKYVAWPEVWLVGVAEEVTASSTEDVLSETITE